MRNRILLIQPEVFADMVASMLEDVHVQSCDNLGIETERRTIGELRKLTIWSRARDLVHWTRTGDALNPFLALSVVQDLERAMYRNYHDVVRCLHVKVDEQHTDLGLVLSAARARLSVVAGNSVEIPYLAALGGTSTSTIRKLVREGTLATYGKFVDARLARKWLETRDVEF